MGRQFRSRQAEVEAGYIEGVNTVLAEQVRQVKVFLEDMEQATRSKHSMVAVFLHDEIATAEELERMIRDIEVHELTEEELADR